MSFEAAVFSFVTADAGVIARISTRLYPVKAPQNPTYPLAVYQRIGGSRVGHLGGDSELVDPRFQFSVLAPTFAAAAAARDALVAALSGYQGLMGAYVVTASVAVNEVDLYYDDVELHQCSFDVFLTYQEQ